MSGLAYWLKDQGLELKVQGAGSRFRGFRVYGFDSDMQKKHHNEHARCSGSTTFGIVVNFEILWSFVSFTDPKP